MHCCFPCFQSQRSKSKRELGSPTREPIGSQETKKQKPEDENKRAEQAGKADAITAQAFTFRELATATKNFRQECLLGEGGFGRVYKGMLASNGKIVAVKQFDRNGMQGSKEFLAEVLTLSRLTHPNLVNLIGYCADGDQRLLVYEYMSGGSVEDHLLDMRAGIKPLDWFTRMKIAFGAAKGLEYLHEANPPVLYHDLKPSNILLDGDFVPKLGDYGLSKLGSSTMDKMHVSLMGTYGYSAPEYSSGGELTMFSDVYSFGVILLELITGRRAIDTTKPNDEQNLVTWAQPIFKDPKRFPDMADPLLNKQFPEKDLNQAVAIAAMCLQEEALARPLMSDVVATISFLSVAPSPSAPPPLTPPPEEKINGYDDQKKNEAEDSSEDEDNCSAGKADDDDDDEDEEFDDGYSFTSQDDDDDDDDGSYYYDDESSSENEEEDSEEDDDDQQKPISSLSRRETKSLDLSASATHKHSKRLQLELSKKKSDSSSSSVDHINRGSGDNKASLKQKSNEKSILPLSRKSSGRSKEGIGSARQKNDAVSCRRRRSNKESHRSSRASHTSLQRNGSKET